MPTVHQTVDQQNILFKKQENKIQENNQINLSNHIQETSSEDINIKNVKEQEQIKLERNSKSSDVLCKILATSVSVNICNIIQHKLIKPVSQTGIDCGMKKLTAGIDKELNDKMNNLKALRRTEFFQNKDKDNRIGKEHKNGMKDKAALAKANQMIENIKTGGEAGLPQLGPLSDATDRPIRVLDENGQLVCIIGEDKGGKPLEVEYHKPNENNPSGHWTWRGRKEPVEYNTGKNNCLFNVIAEQTGKKPIELRKDTASMMENDKENLANQADDIKRLEQYKKDALIMGGCPTYTKETAKKTIDNSEGKKPYLSKAPGHARHHTEDKNIDHSAKGQHTTFEKSINMDQSFEGMMSADPTITEYTTDTHPILQELTDDVQKVVVTSSAVPSPTDGPAHMNSYNLGVLKAPSMYPLMAYGLFSVVRKTVE
ncbi:unnamed protein product, partial [Didymodactylos carnosus]